MNEIICDLCNPKKLGPTKQFYLVTGRQDDGAGKKEDVGTTYDLCLEHTAMLALVALDNRSTDSMKRINGIMWSKKRK